jgi:hypothetical protein
MECNQNVIRDIVLKPLGKTNPEDASYTMHGDQSICILFEWDGTIEANPKEFQFVVSNGKKYKIRLFYSQSIFLPGYEFLYF